MFLSFNFACVRNWFLLWFTLVGNSSIEVGKIVTIIIILLFWAKIVSKHVEPLFFFFPGQFGRCTKVAVTKSAAPYLSWPVTLYPGAHLSYLLIIVAHQHPPFLIPLHGLTQEILGLKLWRRRRHWDWSNWYSSAVIWLSSVGDVSSSNLCFNMSSTPNCGSILQSLSKFQARIYGCKRAFTRHRLDKFGIERRSEVRMYFNIHLYTLTLSQ